jgi:hypothetical protein
MAAGSASDLTRGFRNQARPRQHRVYRCLVIVEHALLPVRAGMSDEFRSAFADSSPKKIAPPTTSDMDTPDSFGWLTDSLGGRSTCGIGIKDVQPGNRPIVTESDASDEITGLKGQWRVGGGEVAGAHGVSVSVALVGPSHRRNLSPRLGKPVVGEPVVHRGIEARADLRPPGMS